MREAGFDAAIRRQSARPHFLFTFWYYIKNIVQLLLHGKETHSVSLQVWLPLDGNLNNQGIASCSATAGGGVSVVNDEKFGKCYSFDGSDDYIEINSSAIYTALSGGSQPITFSMWLKHTDTNRAVLFGDYQVANGIGFNLELDASATSGWRYYWNGNPDQWVGVSVAPADGKWHHSVCVYTGTQLLAYCDGKNVGSVTVTLSTVSKTSGSYLIGRDGRTGVTAYAGYIADFRIYNNALTAAEIAELYAGKYIHYPLNSMPYSTQTIEYDISGNLNNATASTNLGTFAANTLTPKRYPYYYSFDGTRYLKKTDFEYAGNIWSASIWYYATSLSSGYNCIMCLSSNDGGDTYKKMCASPNTNGNIWCKIENQSIANGASLIQNAWTHLVLTSDGTTGKVYQNGVQTGSVTLSGTISGATCLGIGCRQANAAFTSIGVPWHGGLSDFRFYTKCLTADEVSELYNMGV